MKSRNIPVHRQRTLIAPSAGMERNRKHLVGRGKFKDFESLGLFQIVEPVAMLQKAPQQVPKIVFGPPIQTGARATFLAPSSYVRDGGCSKWLRPIGHPR